MKKEVEWLKKSIEKKHGIKFGKNNKLIFPKIKKISISSLTKIIGISRATYYKRKNQTTPSKELNKALKEAILECLQLYKGIYGRLRIKAWPEEKYGYKVNHKRVYRLIKELGIQSVIRKKRVTQKYKSPEIIMPNILKRNFKSNTPTQKWSIDISYILMFRGAGLNK